MNTSIRKPCTAILVIGVCAVVSAGCSHINRGALPQFESGIIPALRRDAPTMFARARQQELEGDLESAMRTYREIAGRFPEYGPSHHRLAVNLDQTGQPELATLHYQKALGLLPNDSELLCDRGYSLYMQGNYESAAGFLNAAIECNPGNLRAHNNLGMVLARIGNATAAVEQFSMAGCDQRQAMANLGILAPNATIPFAQQETARVDSPSTIPLFDSIGDVPMIAGASTPVEPVVQETKQFDSLRPIENALIPDSAKHIAEQAMLDMDLVSASDVKLAAWTEDPEDNESTGLSEKQVEDGPAEFTLNDETIAAFK